MQRKSVFRSLTFILITLVFAMRVLAAPTYIESAIEVAELYSGVCLSIDTKCSVDSKNSINLGENPSSQINLGHHLLGNIESVQHEQLANALSTESISVFGKELPLWIFSASIFHPPKFQFRPLQAMGFS